MFSVICPDLVDLYGPATVNTSRKSDGVTVQFTCKQGFAMNGGHRSKTTRCSGSSWRPPLTQCLGEIFRSTMGIERKWNLIRNTALISWFLIFRGFWKFSYSNGVQWVESQTCWSSLYCDWSWSSGRSCVQTRLHVHWRFCKTICVLPLRSKVDKCTRVHRYCIKFSKADFRMTIQMNFKSSWRLWICSL